jgi:hypothetical protein
MGIKTFLSNNAETRELHSNPELRSRYYKTTFKKVKALIEEYCEKHGIVVVNVDETHGEMFLQTTKYHMIASIIQVNPFETAVDLKVQTYQLIGRNVPKVRVLKMYEYLNSNLSFKGVGLHP